MKPIKTLSLTLLLILLSNLPCTARSLFENLDNQPGVSRVYISSALLKYGATAITGTATAGGTFNMPQKLNYIEVISSDKPAGAKLIKKEFNAFVKANSDLELLMTSNDDGDKTEIYARNSAEGWFSLVIICSESDDGNISITVLDGVIDASKLSVESDFDTYLDIYQINFLSLR